MTALTNRTKNFLIECQDGQNPSWTTDTLDGFTHENRTTYEELPERDLPEYLAILGLDPIPATFEGGFGTSPVPEADDDAEWFVLECNSPKGKCGVAGVFDGIEWAWAVVVWENGKELYSQTEIGMGMTTSLSDMTEMVADYLNS